MTALDLSHVPWLLLAGLLLPELPRVRLAVAGALLAGLAVASATLVLGDGPGAAMAQRIGERAVQPDYLLYNAVLLLAGVGLAVAALAGSWGGGRFVGSAALAAGVAVAMLAAWPVLRASRPIIAVLAAAAVVMAVLAWSAWAGERGAASEPTAARAALLAWTPGTRWLLAVVATAAALAPDLGVALACLAVLLLVLHVRRPTPTGLWRLPLLPLAAVLAVVTAWIAWRAAGADGLAVRGLADAAFSPALQTLLGVLLLPLLFVVAGVPPCDRFAPGVVFAPVAAALLVRAVLPGLPDAVDHWRSAAALWLLLAAIDAVRRRRGPVLAACAGLFAVLVGGEEAAVPGVALATLASLAELVTAAHPAPPPWMARVAIGAAAAAWTLALRGALAAEVVYSVGMVVVLAAGLLRGAGRPVDA